MLCLPRAPGCLSSRFELVLTIIAFMAGVSFLYGLWNLHALGGGYGVPTVAEAMMDIEACLAVLEHLSGTSPFLHHSALTTQHAYRAQPNATRPTLNCHLQSFPAYRTARRINPK